MIAVPKPHQPPDLPNLVTSWDDRDAWRKRIYASTLKPRTALLALLISDYVNGSRGWYAWPAQDTLATSLGESGHGRRKIAERIKELVDGGWIVNPHQGHRGKGARYYLTIPEVAPISGATQHAPISGATGIEDAPETSTREAPISRAQEAPISGHNMPRKSGPDVPSTPSGVAREHLQSGPSGLASADAEPAADPDDVIAVIAAARRRIGAA